MRYAIRQNATPQGTALVRMEIAAGSLDESEGERGYAHFVEHMAFNGIGRRARGRDGPAARTQGAGLRRRHQCRDQLRADHLQARPAAQRPGLLDTALMLMRETASELTIAPEAVARERGVVLAELRDRNTWQLRNLEDQLAFFNPGSRYARAPADRHGRDAERRDADSLKAFWQREYVPAQTTVIVVGDFPPDLVEAADQRRGSTTGSPPRRSPALGRADRSRRSRTAPTSTSIPPCPSASPPRATEPGSTSPTPRRSGARTCCARSATASSTAGSSGCRASRTRRSAAPASAPATCSGRGGRPT